MKTRIKLASILPHFAEQLQESLSATLKESGLKPEDVELKRAGLSDDDMKLDEGSRSVIHRVSTRDVDRDGEVVIPSGLDLKDYMKNPVVMWGHNYKEPQIGSDEWIKVDDKGYALVAKTIYASTPRATEVWTLRKEGHLKTSSIGFVPIEVVRSNDAGFLKMMDKCREDWPEFKKQADRCQSFVTRGILLEHSDVPIPCNPNALTIAIAKSLNLSPDTIEAFGLKDAPEELTVEKCREFLSSKGFVVTQKQAEGITVLLTPDKMRDGIRILPAQGIRVLAEDTLRENIKNLVDLKMGRV